MEKSKKIKITLGIFYLLVVSSFLYFFLSKFTLEEITSYEFIKNNREYFFDLKESNLILLSLVFLILAIIWVLMAGFGSPVALLAGFIFGQWLGIMIVAMSLTIGATLLYIFANYFLKDFIKNKFLIKFKKLEKKFKKAEFIYLLAYRFIGGIPFALSNVLPCIFNVKIKNFFLATLFGITPQLFLIVSLGSGLEQIIEKNIQVPKIKDMLFSPEIYFPMLAFGGMIILTFVVKKYFFNKN
jgi:uncharacterized membrane protein YdjX (TVP38/TMEM64 family)